MTLEIKQAYTVEFLCHYQMVNQVTLWFGTTVTLTLYTLFRRQVYILLSAAIKVIKQVQQTTTLQVAQLQIVGEVAGDRVMVEYLAFSAQSDHS
jgi:hypothetical protein